LTAKHILIDCTCFSAARQRYFSVDTPTELFDNIAVRALLLLL